MKLSGRMKMIADLVPDRARLADIGCDHAYLPIYLMQQGIAASVIAMDVNPGPLGRAKEHIKAACLEAYIQVRLSDGTEQLKEGEADTLLIAGMGGKLMIRILKNCSLLGEIRWLLLQPQSEILSVREYLSGLGYEIVEESMVLDAGKYYTAMLARQREDFRLYPVYSRYGKRLLEERNPVLKDYLKLQEEKKSAIIRQLEGQKKESHQELLKKLYQEMEYIGTALAYFD